MRGKQFQRLVRLLSIILIISLVLPSPMAANAATAKTTALNYKTKTLVVGNKFDINIKNKVKGTTYTYDYTSKKNSAYVTLNKKTGLVTAKKPGKVTIQCVGTKGKSKKVLKCVITIKEKPKKLKATKVKINGTGSTTIEIGDSVDFDETVTPKGVTTKSIWSVSDSSLFSVDKNTGEVTALKEGSSKLTVKNDSVSDSISITAIPKELPKEEKPSSGGGSSSGGSNSGGSVASITLDQSNVQILADADYQLKVLRDGAEILGEKAVWTSSRPEAASVDATGKVKAASLESLKNKTKSQRTTTITASEGGKSASCEVTVGPIEVYFYQSLSYEYDKAPMKLYQTLGGVQVLWQDTGVKTASFSHPQYVEGLKSVSFDMETSKAENVDITVQYTNRFYTDGSPENIFKYQLAASQLTSGGKKNITIALDDFSGTFNDTKNRETASPLYTGSTKKAYQISEFEIILSGNNPELDTKITNFTVNTETGENPTLFDASKFQEVFQKDSPAYITPTPYNNVRKPRVLIADHAQGVWDRLDDYIALSKEWPEDSFGVDVSVMMYGSNRELIDKLHKEGIKTMYEINKTFPYYSHYVESNDDFLVRSDGTRNSPYFFPAHGEDTTQPATYKAITALLDEAKREGYTEYLLVDYTWPWDGRWGYGDETVAAFREDLNGKDEGMYIGNGDETFKHVDFWEFLKIYNDYPINPSDVANFDANKNEYSKPLTSWNDFVPVSESQASISGDKVKRNLYLFNALWHYEHLKQYQKLGDYAASIGLTFFASFNTEDTMNGTDTYMMGMLRNVEKVGYEYFGDPGGNTTFYHTMRYYVDNMRNNGHDMSLIGEINETGHGPAKYSWDVSFAYYYDAITASKPIDYNNQYISNGSWAGISTYDSGYHFDRYASWYSGAAAFFQTYEENGDRLQDKKDTVLVASRSILEYQGGSINSFAQTGNIANTLDELSVPFDSVGKEGFYEYAKDAKTLVYCPAESSPIHEKGLASYLNKGSKKSVLTHSFVPFTKSKAIIDLKPNNGGDLTWDGEGKWSTYLNDPRVEKEGIMGLSLKSATPVTKAQLSYAGTTAADVKVYTLSGNGVKVLVYADDGVTPLISEVVKGSNKIIYINADISNNTKSNGEFNRAVVKKAMEFTENAKPEAKSTPSMAVHIYDVPGGKSVVLWDRDTFNAQRKNSFMYIGTHKFVQFYRDEMEKMTTPIKDDPDGRYHTVKKPKETIEILDLKPNTSYVLYDFINNTEITQMSDAKGTIKYTAVMSSEMFYLGEAGTEFNKTVADAKATRAKLERFDEKVLEAGSLADIKAANPGENLLVFQGGMEEAWIKNTDGTTVTFEGWDPALNGSKGDWYKIGKKNFEGVSVDDAANVEALPLGNKVPKKIRMVANKNMNTSYDSTILKTFKVTDSSDATLFNYLNGKMTEVGVYNQGKFINDKTEFINSGSLMKLSTELVYHPPWGTYDGQCVYGVVEMVDIKEAISFDQAKIDFSGSTYYLTFKGGMDGTSPNTDGVTLTFEGKDTDGTWKTIGKKNFNGIYYNSSGSIVADNTQWALPLENMQPKDIRVTASKNANTANDALRILEFDVIKADGTSKVDYMAGTLKEKGLFYLGSYDVAVTISDGAMEHNTSEGTIFIHPTYGENSSKDIYGVFTGMLAEKPEAEPLAAAKANNPGSKYFLTFKGGMDANATGSDGVTLVYEAKNKSGKWEVIGKKDFYGIYYNSSSDGSITADNTEWAVPLDDIMPDKVRITVLKNANPASDGMRLIDFKVIDNTDKVAVNFMGGTIDEIGLVDAGVNTPMPVVSDAAVQYNTSEGTIFIHPTYGENVNKNLYGIFKGVVLERPEAEPIDTVKASNPASRYFLTFKGGMDANSEGTDGVTLLLEVKNGASWELAGKKNFNNICYNTSSDGSIIADNTVWAIPLDNIAASEVRITVLKNAHTTQDAMRLTNFQVIENNDTVITDFMTKSFTEIGLVDGNIYTQQAVSDGAMEYKADEGTIFIHPTYGPNVAKNIYGVIN